LQKNLAAMQGANFDGADSRCLSRGTSSTSAFLRVYKPDDTLGNPHLELSILEMPFGEEPIDSLQNLFDAWTLSTSTQSVFLKKNIQISLAPNPVNELLQIGFKMEGEEDLTLNIFNLAGQFLIQKNIKASNNFMGKIETNSLPTGFYYLQLKTQTGETKTLKFVKN